VLLRVLFSEQFQTVREKWFHKNECKCGVGADDLCRSVFLHCAAFEYSHYSCYCPPKKIVSGKLKKGRRIIK
jgi:hypothetical protein